MNTRKAQNFKTFLFVLRSFLLFVKRGTILIISRISRPEVFCKEDVLRNLENSQENTCARVSFLIMMQVSGDSGTGVSQ